MNKVEAKRMARQIEEEPGWHAQPQHNGWSGEWSVLAWPPGVDPDADDSDFYALRFAGDWYKLRQGLAEEKKAGGAA